MDNVMPYVVSVIVALMSGAISVAICMIQIRKNREENNIKYERDKELLQKEIDSRFQQMREEIHLKAQAQMANDVTNNVVNAIMDSPAMKSEINRQAAQSIRNNNSARNRRKKK